MRINLQTVRSDQLYELLQRHLRPVSFPAGPFLLNKRILRVVICSKSDKPMQTLSDLLMPQPLSAYSVIFTICLQNTSYIIYIFFYFIFAAPIYQSVFIIKTCRMRADITSVFKHIGNVIRSD